MNNVIIKSGATVSDLAWAAGLFEGEGCISHQTTAPSCALSMSDEDIVRRFHSLIGKGSVRKIVKSNGLKDLWVWQAAGFRSVQYVIALLWKWLGNRRRTRATEILTTFAGFPARKKRACKRGHDLTAPGSRSNAGACVECVKIRSRNFYLRKQELKRWPL